MPSYTRVVRVSNKKIFTRKFAVGKYLKLPWTKRRMQIPFGFQWKWTANVYVPLNRLSTKRRDRASPILCLKVPAYRFPDSNEVSLFPFLLPIYSYSHYHPPRNENTIATHNSHHRYYLQFPIATIAKQFSLQTETKDETDTLRIKHSCHWNAREAQMKSQAQYDGKNKRTSPSMHDASHFPISRLLLSTLNSHGIPARAKRVPAWTEGQVYSRSSNVDCNYFPRGGG